MKFSNGSITAAILAATSYLGTATTATKHKKRSKSDGGKFIKLLAVQKGRGCSITKGELDVYSLVIRDMYQDTILFQERPGRRASTVSTGNFTQEFSTFFPLDDLPNAAIVFGPSNEQGRTLIVQLSNPNTFNNGTGMKYTVKQSQSQSGVVSLENNGDLMDNSCSLFIDGIGPYIPFSALSGLA